MLGFDGFGTGLGYLLPYRLILVASSSYGPLVNRFGMRRVELLGMAIGGAGMGGLALVATGASSYAALISGLALYSIGTGLTFPMMFAAATSGVHAHDQGIASGLASTCQQVGSALSLALLFPLFNLPRAGGAAIAMGENLASVGAVLVMMVIAVASRDPHRPRKGHAALATAETLGKSGL